MRWIFVLMMRWRLEEFNWEFQINKIVVDIFEVSKIFMNFGQVVFWTGNIITNKKQYLVKKRKKKSLKLFKWCDLCKWIDFAGNADLTKKANL